jgi:FMN reductase
MNERALHLVGIGGSNREGSNTLAILRDLLAIAGERGATTDLIDVHAVRLPVYEPEIPRSEQPQALLDLLPIIQRADGFLIGSPTYHGTISGAVKNLLDAIDLFIDDERGTFAGRPVGVVAYGGASAMNVLNALHHSARGMAGFVVPTVLLVGKGQVTVDDGITNEAVRNRAAALVEEVLQLAKLQHLAYAHADALGD